MVRNIFLGNDFLAVEEDSRLVDYVPVGQKEQTGDIVLGKVDRIMAGIRSAFVDIGRDKCGFLPLEENSQTFTGPALQSGDIVPVQIKKEEMGNKGAFLTRDLTLPGKFVILMPLNRHIGVSAKIEDEMTREALETTGNWLTDGNMGMIMRTAAEEADPEEIRREYEVLHARWESIQDRETLCHAPGDVLFSANMVENLLNDYQPKGINEMYMVDELPPALANQLNIARERRVWLNHGGNIVIDRCEAMTVIDVNTAKDIQLHNKRQAFLRLNLEAAEEIARQVRLRNISGIILIDMVDMDEEEDRQQVLSALAEYFAPDRVKTVIHGMTSLGLVEMTRKRGTPSIYEREMTLCPHCKGNGYIPRPVDNAKGKDENKIGWN